MILYGHTFTVGWYNMKLDEKYIAGFFDGEGCVHIAKRADDYYGLQTDVAQKDVTVLLWLRKKYGGYIIPKDNGNYRWTLSSKRAYKFLKSIYKYTIIKKKQIYYAMKFQDTILNQSNHQSKRLTSKDIKIRVKYYNLLRSLKKEYRRLTK